MNPKVNKDRKTVRMLESLIRMTEAHARLLMKSAASVFDAVSVIVLMEHTLMTQIFNELPPVCFTSKDQYREVRNDLIYKLGLDIEAFANYDEKGELRKKCQTPSPIKRIEDSLFINNLQSFDLSMDMSSMSQNEDAISVKSSSQRSFSTLNFPFSKQL